MVQPTLSDNLEKRAYSFVAQIDKVEEVISFQQPYLSYQQTLQNIRNDSNLSDEEKNQKISDTPVTTYDFQPKLFNTVDLGVRPGFTSVSALIIMAFAIASAFAQYWISRQQLPSKKSQKSKSFRQIMREAADGKEPDQTELNAVMSGQMSKMMPIMMLLIMVNLPGALVFYYLVSNLMTGAQQKFVLSRSESEMEISADKRVIRELNKIEEGKVVKESGGAKVTRITAKSKRRGHKKGHKQELIMNKDESIRFATKYLEDLLSFFGINVAVDSTIDDEVIQLAIPSTSMNSLLIGREANNLRALQHIVSMALTSREAELTRVNVDVADYKRQRPERIAEQAEDWIREVRQTGQPRRLNLNAADRRIVHKVAQDYSDIETHSEGEGRERQLVVEKVALAD